MIVSVDWNGESVQCVKKTIGLRTLTISQEADEWGNEFAFMINGVKILQKAGITYQKMRFIHGFRKHKLTIC